jgi:murein DD-endopeptidase MepM/ murein hydrolase activator NlpD
MLYAHLMKESIPAELVPVEGGPGPVVTKGQFLGLIGKSGTNKPHLHFHIQRGISKHLAGAAEGNDQGVPFSFENVWLREWSGYDLDEDTGSGWHLCDGVGIGESMLVYPSGPEYVGPIKVGPWGNDGLGLKDGERRDFGEPRTLGQVSATFR